MTLYVARVRLDDMQLKTARRRAGLTQAQLADRANVSQQTISKLEAGETVDPSYRLVMRICRALGVTPDVIDEFKVNGPQA